MNLDLLMLRTPRGAMVAALDYEPRRARGVALAVGHGYSSSKHNLDALCAFTASHGFHTVSIDFPGHKLGASGGRLESVADLTDALAAAVDYARRTYGVPVYTMGHSMGAATALRTCAADAQITGMISIATGWRRPAALDAFAARGAVDLRSSYVDGLTLEEVVSATEPLLDPALAAIAGRPALYIAAERDGMVSRASADELFRRAPEPKTFALIASDHTSAGEHARSTVLTWLNERHPR
ncbi:MAG: lysophospholipase [Candidatus Eremiobacteraeota bacterium]|nr:lysophospholipase [Candidatus Eremiobacteraeota bacterium]